MDTGPPNWIAWAADIGSTLGFLATVILAIQAWMLKRKYQRLIRLNRRFIDLSASLIDLSQLIENYTVSSAGIHGWIGSISDHLTSLASECHGRDQQSVNDVLSSVRSIKIVSREMPLSRCSAEYQRLRRWWNGWRKTPKLTFKPNLG